MTEKPTEQQTAENKPAGQGEAEGPKETVHNETAPKEIAPKEIGGRKGPEPTRYGDWEKGGICTDF